MKSKNLYRKSIRSSKSTRKPQALETLNILFQKNLLVFKKSQTYSGIQPFKFKI